MVTTQNLRVFVIDDDPLVVDTLGVLLRANRFAVEGFTSPDGFLERSQDEGLHAFIDLEAADAGQRDVEYCAMSIEVVREVVLGGCKRGHVVAMRSKQHGQSSTDVRVVIDDDQVQDRPRVAMSTYSFARPASCVD